MISLNGAYGEGGGQIVRTALALSTILGAPFEATGIRKGRKGPGLKQQHVTCISALKEFCGASCEGGELGSDKIKYTPGKIKPQTLSIDIGTAGSITLLLQSLLLPCILADGKVRLHIKGGTDVQWSMPIDYFSELLLVQLKKYADIDFKLEQRGYYPKGNGSIELKIKGKYNLENKSSAKKIDLVEQGDLMQVKGVANASYDLMNVQVADREAKAAKMYLSRLDVPVNIRVEYKESLSTGTGITLWAIFAKDEEIDYRNPVRLGADVLGARGKQSEEVGEEAASALVKEIKSGAAVDPYLADNLIPFLAVFGGKMKMSSITEHTKTNMWVCEQFLGKCFEVEGNVISAEMIRPG